MKLSHKLKCYTKRAKATRKQITKEIAENFKVYFHSLEFAYDLGMDMTNADKLARTFAIQITGEHNDDGIRFNSLGHSWEAPADYEWGDFKYDDIVHEIYTAIAHVLVKRLEKAGFKKISVEHGDEHKGEPWTVKFGW